MRAHTRETTSVPTAVKSGAFIEHYNNRRYHESLGNLTPADVYFGQHHTIMRRRKIKELTIQ